MEDWMVHESAGSLHRGGGEGENGGSVAEPIEKIVMRANSDDLRAFVIEAARHDETLERELRATFGIADVRQAKRELQKVTTTLTRRYERGGFIDWHGALDFGHEYAVAVESVMRPFFSSKDAAALVDLAVVRLVQLQRICIDDSDGFFTDALRDVAVHLDRAFALGDGTQRRRLFEVLRDFAEENPGKDRGDIYWFERETIEEFLADRFSQDVEFAPGMVALADERLSALPPAPKDGLDRYWHDRTKWAATRLKAMAALGDPPDALRAYVEANGIPETADVVRLIANSYVGAGMPREAMDLLRENLDAKEPYRSVRLETDPPRIADLLIEIATKTCTDAELAQLYTSLLLMEHGREVRVDDLTRWYDELRLLAGDGAWAGMRARLLAEAPRTTGNSCLAHEGSTEELYERIMADGGDDLMRFEGLLSGAHPRPYIDRYITDALSRMSYANDRRAYREVAAVLAHAAGLPGGREPAQETASSIRGEYPRRSALHDELRSAGFAV